MQRELVERARKGDHDAFAALAAATVGRLYAAARLILRDPDRAEDAVQETLVRCWRDLPTLRDIDRFDAWLHRLFLNACYAELRSAKRQSIEVEIPEINHPSVSDSQSATADRDQIERGVRRLNQEYRTVIVLHHYLGLPLPDAAAAMGIPLGTAKSRLHRATQALRATLESDARARYEQIGGSYDMNQSNDLDQMLTTWTDDLYAAPTERILGKVLERTTRTRQRRSWASLERWLPMAVITRPAAAAPSLRFAWILIAALLAVALVAGGAIVASRLHLAAVAIPQGDSAVIAYGVVTTTTDQIAGDLYTARADGSDQRHVTSGPGYDSQPVWSPDGTRIAFHRYENGSDSLMVIDGGAGDPVTLASNQALSQDCLNNQWTEAWSPDGKSLVFPTRENCTGGFDLNIVAADGSSPAARLLADGTNGVSAAWSPDGRRIAFIGSVGTGTSGLYVADVGPDGGLAGGLQPRQIAANVEWNLSSFADPPDEMDQPRWSPDGKEIAVTSVTKGHFLEQADGILIVNADGSGQRTLTARAGNPAWSPNGQQLAFQRTVDPSEYANGRPCTVRTWIVNQDGSNEHQLDPLGDNCSLPPLWSPDGTRLASVLITPQGAGQDPLFHFAVVMADGSKPPVNLGDAYGTWQPVVAPLPSASSPAPS